MKPKPPAGEIPRDQRRSFELLFDLESEIAKLSASLTKAQKKKQKLIATVFDRIEKHPSRYTYVTRPKDGKPGTPQPMTLELAKQARARYMNALAKGLAIAGPGCGNCPNKQFCICLCDCPIIGCCYLCLSPAIVQC